MLHPKQTPRWSNDMKVQTIYTWKETSRLQILSPSLPPPLRLAEKKKMFSAFSFLSNQFKLCVQSFILWHLSFHPLPPFFNSPPSILLFLSPPFVIWDFWEKFTPVQGAMARRGGVCGASRNKITEGLLAIKTLSFFFSLNPICDDAEDIGGTGIYWGVLYTTCF